MNKKWLYYRCRATTTTSIGPKTCNARSIKAGLIESLVWDKIKVVLSDPEVVMSELNHTAEDLRKQLGNSNFDKDKAFLFPVKLKSMTGKRNAL